MVAYNSFRWVSFFLKLQIKFSHIHFVSFDSLMLQNLAKTVNAPHNFSKNSLSLCFLFMSLYVLNVIFGGLKNLKPRGPKILH